MGIQGPDLNREETEEVFAGATGGLLACAHPYTSPCSASSLWKCTPPPPASLLESWETL